jgi:hypothetical protein
VPRVVDRGLLGAEISSLLMKSIEFFPERDTHMRTSLPNAGRPAYYSVREAAWILGIEPSTVARDIRVGTVRAVRRRGRLVVPASEIVRLLSLPADRQSGGAS